MLTTVLSLMMMMINDEEETSLSYFFYITNSIFIIKIHISGKFIHRMLNVNVHWGHLSDINNNRDGNCFLFVC